MAKARKDEITSQEPVGIVISRGSRSEEAPRLSAYVWGPVPDVDIDAELAVA
jgi:hypothetical protein